jgi:hypothetical protein
MRQLCEPRNQRNLELNGWGKPAKSFRPWDDVDGDRTTSTSSHDIADIGKAKGSRGSCEQAASEGIAWDALRQVL